MKVRPRCEANSRPRTRSDCSRRVRFSGSLCLERSAHSRTLNRLFSSSCPQWPLSVGTIVQRYARTFFSRYCFPALKYFRLGEAGLPSGTTLRLVCLLSVRLSCYWSKAINLGGSGALPSLFYTSLRLLLAPGPKVFQAHARSCIRCRPSQRVCVPGGSVRLGRFT